MVVPLGPGKFYGSSLPRPRIYTDVKFNSSRVDPPAPLLDPLLSWANEAHWSMGGLSFRRLRLQGRIEGNVTRLRRQREKTLKDRSPVPAAKKFSDESPPPAPAAATKRRRLLVDEEEEERSEEEEVEIRVSVGEKRKLARRLGDDFDRVATRKSPRKNDDVAVEVKKRNLRKIGEKVSGGEGSIRVSPRLAKRGSGA